MGRHLLIALHLHADGMGTARFHGMHQGAPEWPPAPARIFQALVAGAARGETLPASALPALRWLEGLPPPLIVAPARTVGQMVSLYVPNNDADALADPSDLSGIRTAKRVQPSLFDGAQPLLYAWALPERAAAETESSEETAPADETQLRLLVDTAKGLYQLGRGVDMAWADASVVADDTLQLLLRQYRGVVHRAASDGNGQPVLPCPLPGSLDSLIERHRVPRLRQEGAGRKARVLFTNPPKPRFEAVSYAPQQHQVLYDLRERGAGRPWPWPLQRAAALVEQVRDAAAARLHIALPEAVDAIDRCVSGRSVQGRGDVPVAQRVRITGLPSIGAQHVDPSIRRVLVEFPNACTISAADLEWAFSGLDRVDADTGEASNWQLTRADQSDMLAHYRTPTRHWQSVTAVALPDAASRRRIEPSRRRTEAKPAPERQTEEDHAVAAVHQALRHAGVEATAVQVRVQREPFTGRGKRAEVFADGTRFAKERLWHVALRLDRPVAGPLVIGDGRYVGLGLLAPAAPAGGFEAEPGARTGEVDLGVMAFDLVDSIDGAQTTDPVVLARALRRAVMARAGVASARSPNAGLDTFFTGHATDSDRPDARPARHLAFHWDPPRRRWLVLAPHRFLHRQLDRVERKHLALLDRATDGLTTLRAGAGGCHVVQRVLLSKTDPLLAGATTWESVTPYAATRHRRLASASAALTADVLTECRRHGLPEPQVTVLALDIAPGTGLRGRLRLRFSVAVQGPVLLGRSAMLGGGLFAAAAS